MDTMVVMVVGEAVMVAGEATMVVMAVGAVIALAVVVVVGAVTTVAEGVAAHTPAVVVVVAASHIDNSGFRPSEPVPEVRGGFLPLKATSSSFFPRAPARHACKRSMLFCLTTLFLAGCLANHSRSHSLFPDSTKREWRNESLKNEVLGSK